VQGGVGSHHKDICISWVEGECCERRRKGNRSKTAAVGACSVTRCRGWIEGIEGPSCAAHVMLAAGCSAGGT
jgi:hypothetical protein